MTEIKDCLPQHAVPHFINLRNVRLESESSKLQLELAESRARAAANGSLLTGGQQLAEWKRREQFLTTVALGYVEDAFQTCRLYDLPLTRQFCDCLLKAVDELLTIQNEHAIQAQAQGTPGFKVPVSVFSQMGNSSRLSLMNRIRAMVETTRVEDEKAKRAITKNRETGGDTYQQIIHHHGQGPLNTTQSGDIYVEHQSITIEQVQTMRPDLSDLRAALKAQNSLEADEGAGLVASAEKAATEGNESKMLGFLKQIPAAALDVVKGASSAALLSYLKAHGIVS